MADNDHENNETLTAEQSEKLAHFHEITGIQSLDECRQILEVFEWNMENAVQSALGEQIQTSSSSSSSNSPTNSTRYNNNNRTLANANNERASDLNPLRRVNTSQQSLPNVNYFAPRLLTYQSASRQALVPKTFFQWTVFFLSLPFKFIFSSLYELATFFWSFFEPSPLAVTDYDPLANVAEFAIDYNQKYGSSHAEFYEGSYAQAVNQAKRDLKLLLVYIHQNDNKDCDQFATETMSNNDLVEYLRTNFVVWACGKNLPEGYKVFNALKAKRAPFLGIIVLKHSRMTLVSKIEGPISAPELLIQLSNLVAESEPELVAARTEREQLNQNQLIRQQQDAAYEESLRADREKARLKREKEEELKRQQELERQKEQEEVERKNNILNRKSELRKQIAETQQPDSSDSQSIKLVVKLPTGTRIERVFLKRDPLSSLYNFVFAHEECPHNFEIVRNFPRKVIECDAATQTSILDYGINESMLLYVNDSDA